MDLTDRWAQAMTVLLAGLLVTSVSLALAEPDPLPASTGSDVEIVRDVPTGVSSPSPTRVPFTDLERRLLAPGGDYRLVPDTESRLGTLDAEGFAARFGEGAAATDAVARGLEALGFERARGHLWVDEGRVYGAVVVRFDDGAGAKKLKDSSAAGATGRFTSATVPGAVTYVESVDGFSVQHGIFARGRFVYEVTLTTPTPEDDHAEFDALLLAQRDHAERSDP